MGAAGRGSGLGKITAQIKMQQPGERWAAKMRARVWRPELSLRLANFNF
jgi:hypothetical protein